GQFEIIVVDNNSTDDTKRVVKNYIKHLPQVTMHYVLEPRLGLHYGRNAGAKVSKFDILYFTDDDVIADPQVLSEISRPFLIDPAVATATGRVLPKWEKEPPRWVQRLMNNSFLSLMDPSEDLIIAKSINYLYGC